MGRVIRVARDEENRVFVRRRSLPAVQPDAASFSKSRPAMDSFELNKVLGAVLGTCLILLSLNIAAGALFSTHNPEKPGYEIAVQEEAPGKPGDHVQPGQTLAVLDSSDIATGTATVLLLLRPARGAAAGSSNGSTICVLATASIRRPITGRWSRRRRWLG